ncbi:MAG: hypothetical protein RIB65_21710 [Ilumatobacter fluminis]|uniref:hypothetical protein n=1 Tax=Ilumatobacter fluminis TaxID=467091 RepID=UPI0032EA9C29
MSRPERIAEYIERQFVNDQGSVDDNVDTLFASDVEYHTPTATLSRSDLITIATTVRNTPRSRRRIEATQFSEEGDTVRWLISATLPGMAEDGGDVEQTQPSVCHVQLRRPHLGSVDDRTDRPRLGLTGWTPSPPLLAAPRSCTFPSASPCATVPILGGLSRPHGPAICAGGLLGHVATLVSWM